MLEIFVQNDCKNRVQTANFNYNQQPVLVHQYNPFNKDYKTEQLLKNAEICLDKLNDLYGYSLRAGFVENGIFVMRDPNFRSGNVWNAINGTEVSLIDALLRALNFTVDIATYGSNIHI